MNQIYNQNYTKEQVEIILNTIQECVKANRYIISVNNNRVENIDFIRKYNLTNEKIKGILLKIKSYDFCHSLNNIKLKYEDEILYVFCPQIILVESENKEKEIDIYIKFNIIDSDNGKRVITISFHQKNKPIDYLFR